MSRNFAPSLNRRQGDNCLSDSYWNSGVMTQEKKRGPPGGTDFVSAHSMGEITGEENWLPIYNILVSGIGIDIRYRL
eukprot:COSAG02_NODE_1218_length_13814_cov_250.988844_6_plen_77_part_00